MNEAITTIPARQGKAAYADTGQRIKVINTLGNQVVDTWAFLASDLREQLSMEHSRSATYRILFKPGDSLVSNRFRSMLSIEDDTSPGIHDTLHAACSAASYRFYGHDQSHPNCEDNLREVMLTRDLELDAIPCPWNLFEHALVAADGSLSDETSAARPGETCWCQALRCLAACAAPSAGHGANLGARDVP